MPPDPETHTHVRVDPSKILCIYEQGVRQACGTLGGATLHPSMGSSWRSMALGKHGIYLEGNKTSKNGQYLEVLGSS